MSDPDPLGKAASITALILAVIAIGANGLSLLDSFQRVSAAKVDAQTERHLNAIRLFFDDVVKPAGKDAAICNNQQSLGVMIAFIKDYDKDESGNSKIAEMINARYAPHILCPSTLAADARIDPGAPTAQANTSYAALNVLHSPNMLNAIVADSLSTAANAEYLKGYTVYIQYKQDLSAAQNIQSEVQKAGAAAPGLERVDEVPRTTQVRVYKDSQLPLAGKLKAPLSGKVDVVSLQKAYPNLPANRIEIWIADPPAP